MAALIGCNRTIMELKHDFHSSVENEVMSCNRTIMELKLSLP